MEYFLLRGIVTSARVAVPPKLHSVYHTSRVFNHDVARLRQADSLLLSTPHYAYGLCGVTCDLRRVVCLRHGSFGEVVPHHRCA